MLVNDAAMERKLIKPRDAKSQSCQYAAYVPFWA